ncbi:MAG: hypothetical protein EOP45_09320 [Sphingobacteriaceae bacterium]|nr:MAG: hypothetical protein EOP45_09320 [Sphingobacteriaceae bacterium]
MAKIEEDQVHLNSFQSQIKDLQGELDTQEAELHLSAKELDCNIFWHKILRSDDFKSFTTSKPLIYINRLIKNNLTWLSQISTSYDSGNYYNSTISLIQN